MDCLLIKIILRWIGSSLWIFTLFHSLYGNTINDITLYGNTRTKNYIILRELSFSSGDTISRQSLLENRNWLVRLNFLKRIEFLEKPSQDIDKKHLLIIVQEKLPTEYYPILGSDDRYGWSYGMGASLNNALGRREKLDLSFMLGKIKRIQAQYSDPWFGGSWHLSSHFMAFYQDWPYLYPDYPRHFDLHQTGCCLKLGKYWGRYLQSGLLAGFERTTSNLKDILISDDHTDELMEAGFFINYDTRDWPNYPQSGYYIDLVACHQSEMENLSFNRLALEINRFQPVFKENILALQCHLDLSDGTVPVYKRLHLGGSLSIRGYANGEFWADNAFYSSMEYRFPMIYIRNPDMGIHVGYAGVLFVDAGSSWETWNSIQNMSFYRSLGFGIHAILSPYVMRLEYANHFEGWGYIVAEFGAKF